jgi:hypothetical protein
MMVFLHTFITSNVPPGVPLEWNVMMVYGGFFLFYENAHVSIFSMSPACGAFLSVMLIAIPLLGSLYPSRVSFLMSMRYYAGNWPFGIWLFRGESHKKLEQIKKSADWVPDQLARFYDRETAMAITSRVVGFRLLHLQGHTLADLVPLAVDRLEDYQWVDGEIVCGLVLGYNFGDGHLADEELLHAIQEQCGFEEGELRVIMVEGQPVHKHTVHYRVHDAKTGLITEGHSDVRILRQRQPWEDTPSAIHA